MFFRVLALLVIVSFGLHLVWEFAHYRLYTGYENLTPLPIYLWATIGDVLYTLAAFALASAFKRGLGWVREATVSDYLGLAALGFFLALYVEYKAMALQRWVYLPEMPILPMFGVGLSPVLQMVILLPLSVAIVSFIEKRL
jgi:hypothetical protein